jgi:hypothetical protein
VENSPGLGVLLFNKKPGTFNKVVELDVSSKKNHNWVEFFLEEQ